MSEALITKLSLQPGLLDEKYTKIQVATVFGITVIVSKEQKEGELGVYFDTESQLSPAFATANKLYKSLGGYVEENGRVRTLKLGGVKSTGLWMPLSSLAFTGADLSKLREGDRFQKINKVEIVNRWVSEATKKELERRKAALAKQSFFKRLWNKFKWKFFPPNRNASVTKLFPQHYDTRKFGEVLKQVTPPYYCIVTEKLHGTSARQGRVPMRLPQNWLVRLANYTLFPVFKRALFSPLKGYKDVYGTRRTVRGNVNLGEAFPTKVTDSYRADYANKYKEKLHKNEVIFYEIVGYESTGKMIMPTHSTEKIDKAFTKQWGKEMQYTYGCVKGESKAYLYRIALVNEDGTLFEMPWSYVKKRAQEIGMSLVPIVEESVNYAASALLNADSETYQKNLDKNREAVMKRATELGEGASLLSPTHIKEGVCVRFENSNGIFVGKLKSWEFTTMEHGEKEEKDYADVEELESLTEDAE